MKKVLGVTLMALMMVLTSAGVAAASELVDSDAVSCLVRVYVNEGGESGLDCLG